MRSSQGKGRRRHKGLLATLASVLALGALAVPAQAVYEETGTIGNETFSNGALGVAVDEVNDYVYLASFVSDWTSRFDLAGTPVGDPLGVGLGLDNYSVAVHQGNGNVYTLPSDTSSAINPAVVTIYDSTGALVGSPFDSGLISAVATTKIAVDSTGDVYLPGWAQAQSVLRFSEAGVAKPSITGSGANELVTARSVDVDDAGNIYVVDSTNFSTGLGGRVQKFDPSGNFITEIASAEEGGGLVAVAVNRGNGDVFVIEDEDAFEEEEDVPPTHTARVTAYEEDGGDYVAYEDLDTSNLSPIQPGAEKSQITVDSRDGTVYITDPTKDVAHVFAEPQPPMAVTGSASGVTQAKATLSGEVDPNLVETDCVFLYGEAGGPLGEEAPCESSPGAGSLSVEVSADLSGLSAKTDYEFVLVAENDLGEGEGDIVGFKTLAHTCQTDPALCPKPIPTCETDASLCPKQEDPKSDPPPTPSSPPVADPPAKPKPKPLKCKKGFKKKKVKGKAKCVKVKKKKARKR